MRELKAYLLVSSILGVIFSAVIIIIAIVYNLLILLFLIGPIIMLVTFGFVCRETASKRSSSTITIEDGYIEGKNESESTWRNLDYVKNIIDYGDWYVFSFAFPHKARWFICQKDLIVEGTIEEFEQLFEGKIIRKHK